jgi:N-acetyl-anhydromuramyl-L-alanine amidase AmpD
MNSWDKLVNEVAINDFQSDAEKVICICQGIGETGRGKTEIATKALNFWGLKWRVEMHVPSYLSLDGYQYCKFSSHKQAVEKYHEFIFARSPYAGIEKHTTSPDDYINHISVPFCPPGNPGSPWYSKWYRDHGNRNYAQYILSFKDEAIQLLRSAGGEIKLSETLVVPSSLTPYQIVKQYDGDWLSGIVWKPVKNYTKSLLYPKQLVMHYTAALGLGIIDGWNNPLTFASAHFLIMRDGAKYQCVPMDKRAWSVYNFNSTTLNVEFENLGCFAENEKKATSWYNPETDSFCRWFWPGIIKSAPKSEFVLLRHPKEQRFLWWHTFTEYQIQSAKILIPILMDYAKKPLLCGHEDLDKGKVDPGPAFFWSEIR